jgi:hypothetical protein
VAEAGRGSAEEPHADAEARRLLLDEAKLADAIDSGANTVLEIGLRQRLLRGASHRQEREYD